ncbi:MAG: hypothetical protein ACRC2R_16945 [Xenococcaceae cyanobacterium]
MNIELAEKVLAHIKEHREAFNMSFGVESGYGTHKIDSYPCGTVACIAGWTILLSYPSNRDGLMSVSDYVDAIEHCWDWSEISLHAQKLLEISHMDAIALFTPPEWDEDEFYKTVEDEAIAQFEEFIKRERESANLIDIFSP